MQNQDTRLLPVATSAGDAKVMLEALEAGTDGVVLHTQEPEQASRAHSFLAAQSHALQQWTVCTFYQARSYEYWVPALWLTCIS